MFPQKEDPSMHQPTAGFRPASLTSLPLLWIQNGAARAYGADQAWYPTWFRRLGGCGPTTAANVLWYLAATRPIACGALCLSDCRRREAMVRLMQQTWNDITPGLQGVHKPETFCKGIERYGRDRGVLLQTRCLDIPDEPEARPSGQALEAFLQDALQQDLPVAFLNLSNGGLENLEGWHWVTLVAQPAPGRALMYDQGRAVELDLSRWLGTTTRGGALIATSPQGKGTSRQGW